MTNITSSVATATTLSMHVKTFVEVKGDPHSATAGNPLLVYFPLLYADLFSVTSPESALALIFNSEDLPALAHRGGILTLLSAVFDILINWLKNTGHFVFTSEIIQVVGDRTSQWDKAIVCIWSGVQHFYNE